MIIRLALVFSLVSVHAFAQPSTTPTVVDRDDPVRALVLPALYARGNLRVSISCAEAWLTPEQGLSLLVDGVPLPARELNGVWGTSTDDDGVTSDVWEPTDTGFVVAPGRHHLELAAPGCAPASFDMDAYPDHAQHAVGRLAVTDSSWMGPVGAPDGLGITLGVIRMRAPDGPTSNTLFGQNATFDPDHTATGGELTLSFERRSFVFAMDFAFAVGSIDGTVSGDGSSGGSSAFSGTAYVMSTQLRIGTRIPLHEVALMGGSGLGAQMWIDSTTLDPAASPNEFVSAPSGVDGTFYLPMWVAATIKPGCNWGFQLLGQYDVHPTSMDTNGVELVGGLMYQPSASCSEPAGVHVSTL